MHVTESVYSDDLVTTLQSGALVIIPTDTIYGICCSIKIPKSVERVYEVKERNRNKACIVLISDLEQLDILHIDRSTITDEILHTYWPGPVSVILPIQDMWHDTLLYLHRGTHSLVIRLPDNEGLRDLIRKTGPLIATSANKEGQVTCTTIQEAIEIFGTDIDTYVDGGVMIGNASRVIDLTNPENPVEVRN